MIKKSKLLSDEFLKRLTMDLNDDDVQAIILHGSHVRGEAHPLYSDVDLVIIEQEAATYPRRKRFMYRDGYLLSISSRSLSAYRERFARPETAIFAVPGVREARILLDKDGNFQAFQQEAWAWTWAPLQNVANAYASQLMVEQTEIVLKTLRALALHDLVALSEMMIDLLSAITEAVAVQRGVMVHSGNTYFHQVQEAAGQQSIWTQYHLRAAGIAPQTGLSLEERGKETLYLYKETAQLLRSSISSEHWEAIGQTIQTIEQAIIT